MFREGHQSEFLSRGRGKVRAKAPDVDTKVRILVTKRGTIAPHPDRRP